MFQWFSLFMAGKDSYIFSTFLKSSDVLDVNCVPGVRGQLVNIVKYDIE